MSLVGWKEAGLPTSDIANAGGDGAEVAVLEPGGGLLAKDKVRGTCDQAPSVDLVALLGEKGVLEAGKLAGIVARSSVG